MHPDLSAHLHSPECNRLIEALLQCHKENKFKRFLGACNDANTAMLRCLKAENVDRKILLYPWIDKKRSEKTGIQQTPVVVIKPSIAETTLLIINNMETFEDIEDEYLSQGTSYETLTERAFTSLYTIEPNGGGHYRLLVHSNKICLLTLAPSHPIITENMNISSINYQANDSCNRLSNKVIGKKKSGGQYLSSCSILCTIQCEDHVQPFIVRSNLVAKLIEMNEGIAKEPNLLKDYEKGYIAIVYPKLNDYEREIGRWMSEEEYLKEVIKK